VDYRVIQVPDHAGRRSKRLHPKSGRSWKPCWPWTGRASRGNYAHPGDDNRHRVSAADGVRVRRAPSAAGARPAGDRIVHRAPCGDQGHAGLPELISRVSRRTRRATAEHSDLAHWHALGEAGVLRLAADRVARRWHVPTRVPALRLQGSGLLPRALLRIAIIRSSGKVEWVPDKSVRNEPLDLAVLCRAAARSVESIASRTRIGCARGQRPQRCAARSQ